MIYRNYILILLLSITGLAVAEEKPFPENRVTEFYRKQAKHYLKQTTPLPPILAPFPGLDGGAWGHWGQNPESDNSDSRLGEVDFGGLLMQVTSYKGGRVNKGVNVKVGEFTALFDPEKARFVTAWKGSMVLWSSSRYGITSGVKASGEPLDSWTQVAAWPENVPRHYQGFYRNGEKVVFVYKVGSATVYETLSVKGGKLQRNLSKDGELSIDGVTFDDGETKALTKPGAARWADKTVITKGTLGDGTGAYAVDTLTVPYRDANPFKTPMRIGGVGVMPNGDLAVCTLMGDVWIVSGVDDDLEKLTWRRFASGLHQGLGLVVRDGKIHVIGRDQLTRLHDLNGDGEADFYECVTNDFPTEAGNSFAMTLHQDEAGAFYWFTKSDGFGVTRFREGGKPESIATGLRGVNGMGVSPDGKIVLAMPQEGDWQPASGVFEVGGESYHGHDGPRSKFGKRGYQMPLCFIPRGVDNSAGDVRFLPTDDRMGPLSGRMIGTSFGYCEHYLVLRETVGDSVQGGIMPLEGEFISGAHRLCLSKKDGHLYVAGTDGWQSYAKVPGSLQRLRYVGGDLPLPTKVETKANGMIIHFNTEIDPASVKKEAVFAQQWNYLHSEAYGSQEYSVKTPGVVGHDPVNVQSLHLLADKKSLFVEIQQIHPVMQLHLYMELTSASGRKFTPDLYYSVFKMGENFTDFPGYTAVKKETWNDFPIASESPVDPRLLKQEKLGKIVGDAKALAAIKKLKVKAVAGLKFEPTQLTAKAGSRAALTVANTDPSMPHNLVLLHAKGLEAVGEGSMALATDPKGPAKHYVIENDAVIAMSPLLQPGSSYTVYFNVPKEPGEYPYICTFPGHWQVTRGVLTVTE